MPTQETKLLRTILLCTKEVIVELGDKADADIKKNKHLLGEIEALIDAGVLTPMQIQHIAAANIIATCQHILGALATFADMALDKKKAAEGEIPFDLSAFIEKAINKGDVN